MRHNPTQQETPAVDSILDTTLTLSLEYVTMPEEVFRLFIEHKVKRSVWAVWGYLSFNCNTGSGKLHKQSPRLIGEQCGTSRTQTYEALNVLEDLGILNPTTEIGVFSGTLQSVQWGNAAKARSKRESNKRLFYEELRKEIQEWHRTNLLPVTRQIMQHLYTELVGKRKAQRPPRWIPDRDGIEGRINWRDDLDKYAPLDDSLFSS